MRYKHVMTHVATYAAEWGGWPHIQQTPFNKVFVCITEKGEEGVRLVANGNVIQTGEQIPNWSVSPEGKFAFARRCENVDGQTYYQIFMDGEELYRVAMDNLHDLRWISAYELAWTASMDFRKNPEDQGMHYFINGQETNLLQFQRTRTADGHGAQLLVMDFRMDRGYAILDNGVVKELGQARKLFGSYEETSWRVFRSNPYAPQVLENMRGKYVCYRGMNGPCFSEISGRVSEARKFVFSMDKNRVAYRGVAASFWTELKLLAISPIAYPLFFLYVASHDPRARYFRPARRYYVVDHPRKWENSYHFVEALWYQENGELVAEVKTKRGMRVVIDEEEGPEFDEVDCSCFSAEEKAVTYFARRGNEYFRVRARKAQ